MLHCTRSECFEFQVFDKQGFTTKLTVNKFGLINMDRFPFFQPVDKIPICDNSNETCWAVIAYVAGFLCFVMSYFFQHSSLPKSEFPGLPLSCWGLQAGVQLGETSSCRHERIFFESMWFLIINTSLRAWTQFHMQKKAKK